MTSAEVGILCFAVAIVSFMLGTRVSRRMTNSEMVDLLIQRHVKWKLSNVSRAKIETMIEKFAEEIAK